MIRFGLYAFGRKPTDLTVVSHRFCPERPHHGHAARQSIPRRGRPLTAWLRRSQPGGLLGSYVLSLCNRWASCEELVADWEVCCLLRVSRSIFPGIKIRMDIHMYAHLHICIPFTQTHTLYIHRPLYINVDVHIYIYIHLHIHTHTYTYPYTHNYIYVCTHTHMPIYINVWYTHLHAYAYIFIYLQNIYICITHMHTCSHTHA